MATLLLTFITALVQGSLGAAQSHTNHEVLQKIWGIGKTQSCTQEMRSQFSEKQFDRIASSLANQEDRDVLASVLNPFLFSLGMSHTKFLTITDEDYFFFKSHSQLVNPKLPAPPALFNPGVQLGRDTNGYFIREVLDGLSAKKAGVFRDDRILSLNGQAFKGVWSDKPGPVTVGVIRNGEPLTFNLDVHSLNWSNALHAATRESVQVIDSGAGKIGHVRLWTGTHPQSASQLQEIVSGLKPKVSAVILDLRGGYGGSWWEHLDPFFPDSNSYFSAQLIESDGSIVSETDSAHVNPDAFTGPMVVLINEGVRSGKEALAYQFKKTARARLIGSKTPGYFSVGAFMFADEPVDYAFYLCVRRVTLNHTEIEGVGITPDEDVPFTATGPFRDSQLDTAIQYLRTIIITAKSMR